MTQTPSRTPSEFSRRAVQAAFACAVGTMLASGTAVIGTFGMFMLPILKEFGWGRGQVSAAVMTMSCTTALCSPLVGRLLDRWGVRRVVLPGFVLYAVSVMLLSQASSHGLLFYLSFVAVGIPAGLVSILPYVKTVSAWFNRRRGLVLALVGVLATAGGSQMPLIARRLIAAFGWRGAYVGIGVIILVVGLPVLALLLREPEGRAAGTATAEPVIVSGLDAKEVRRTPTYWLLAAVQIFTTFATGGIIAHLAPMMIDRGETATKGAEALALCTLGGTGGRLLMGLLLDRFRSPRIAVPFALGAVGGVLLLIYARSAPQFVAAGMLISVCMGAEGELAPYLHSRYFGLKAFAETFGLQFLFLAFANGVGITAMGAVFDAAGSYRPLLWAHAVLFSLVAGVFLLLGPYRYSSGADATASGRIRRPSAPAVRRAVGGSIAVPD